VAPSLHQGLCHCRAVGFLYRTALEPESWPIRACQCSFCRAHGAISASDPEGSLQFVEHLPNALHRYRFGQKTADFLLCSVCGMYLGAMMQSESTAFGVINVRMLYSLLNRLRLPERMSYDNEGLAERRTRRESRWTPIVIC
jgi:hypothetical protein